MLFRLYTPVFALTLLLSAALLFSIQPMFSKLILPLLGGTSQVWNTAMLFFQVCLLGGYAYAHFTSKFLSVRAQAIMHILVLLVFTAVLPLGIPEGWIPPADKDPTLWQLALMASTVGGPFFFLSASAPMFQRWFAVSGHPDADNPYFLYGASNLGSMAALLSYPVLIEPILTLSGQSHMWMGGYIALIIMAVLCAGLVWNNAKNQAAQNLAAPLASAPIRWARRLKWIWLAFVPSSMMLGVTVFITTDIATVPLLWILPLALYVGTFILVFARKPLFTEEQLSLFFGIAVIAVIGLKIVFNYSVVSAFFLVGMHLLTFFLAALVCHSELVKSKPASDRLTEFYLFMSLGGALGGFFNAIIAPQFFVTAFEYGLILGLAVFVRYMHTPGQEFKSLLKSISTAYQQRGLDLIFHKNLLIITIVVFVAVANFTMAHMTLALIAITIIGICLLIVVKQRWLFGALVALLLVMFPFGFYWGHNAYTNYVYEARNFFGVIKVVDTVENERFLMHGTTNHGTQTLNEKYRLSKQSYYNDNGPLGDLFSYYDKKKGEQKVAVLGLGIGAINCYRKDGRHYDFFEIDPDIAYIAENKDMFTYLSDCNSPYDIILGDGRLKIAEVPDKTYDFIVLDAFSSDNVPAHIMTVEAFNIYKSKLKDDGAIVSNISNNFLDLEPVVTRNAEAMGIPALAKVNGGGFIDGTKIEYFPSHWTVLTHSETLKAYLEKNGWEPGVSYPHVKAWTDQFSNILSVIGNKTVTERYKKWKEEHPDAKTPDKEKKPG